MLFIGCLSEGSHEDHKFSACSLSLIVRSWRCDCLFWEILKTLYFQKMMFMHLVSNTKRLGQVVVFFSARSCSSCLVSLLACDTRPNAVLKDQQFAFVWRSTAWCKNTKARWPTRGCVWDQITSEWSGQEDWSMKKVPDCTG